MRLIDADAYAAEMAKRQDACGKWMDSAIDELTLQRAEGAYTMLCEAKLTLDEMPTIPAPRWVRCKEEPPKEEYRTYLVYTDTGYMCSCRWTNNMYGLGESDRWGWSIADVPQFQKVTHWMPIEPPKEDA